MQGQLIQGDSHLRVLFDAMPAAVFVVDHDMRVLDTNRAAEELLDSATASVLGEMAGDLLQCLNAVRSENGCGSTQRCKECVVRNSVQAAGQGASAKRQMVSMLLEQNDRVRNASFLVTAAPLIYEDRPLVLLVLEDITELEELKRLVPMCSYCRKVRDDTEFWQDVEQYLDRYTGMSFSHGVCPDCMREHFPDVADKVLAAVGEPEDEHQE